MKYIHDPERPKEPILEASPREIDAHRDWLRRCLRSSWKLDDADVEDAVQNVVIIACRLIAEKRVRGKYAIPHENRLQSLLRVVLRNFAANIKRFQRSTSRIFVDDISLAEIVPDAQSGADVKLEACPVAGVAAMLIPFFQALESRRLRSGLLISAVVYVIGALGFEVLGQHYAATHGWSDPVYVTLSAIEEFLEMFGPLIFLHSIGCEIAGSTGIVIISSGQRGALWVSSPPSRRQTSVSTSSTNAS